MIEVTGASWEGGEAELDYIELTLVEKITAIASTSGTSAGLSIKHDGNFLYLSKAFNHVCIQTLEGKRYKIETMGQNHAIDISDFDQGLYILTAGNHNLIFIK